MRNVTLILDDGSRFSGKSFGYEKPVAGEVVFNTAMTGYPESLTDPSYAGQLMTLTYPLVGNYGVPPFTIEANGLPTFMESEKIHAEAIIVSDYSEKYNHWNAVESLADWLKREQIPGITGIDTRELTKVLREHGVMMGKIVFDDEPDNIPEATYAGVNYVDKVSCKEVIRYNEGEGKKKVVLVDCGVKANIIRCLLKRDVEIIRVPWNYDFNGLEFDGLFISNGPGDPEDVVPIQNLKVNDLGNHNPRLHSDELLIALAITAKKNETAAKALSELCSLKGSEAHCTVMLPQEDASIYQRLGINVTMDPRYQQQKLYHKR